MPKKEYNGWWNYETWVVKLWMDNDEGSYNYWTERAQDAYDGAKDTPSVNARLTGTEPFTHEECATLALSEQLKDHFEEQMHDLLETANASASVWADLLGAALSEVNWYEIAENMIGEIEPEQTNVTKVGE